MKRLAFVSGLQLFPPLGGGQLRSTGLARALAHHGFQVDIYSLIGRSADYRARVPSALVEHGPHLTEYVDRHPAKAALQLASYRLDLPPMWIWEFLKLRVPPPLAERLAAADAVIADFPFLGSVFARTDKPTVLNTHNVEHHLVSARRLEGLVRAQVRRIEDRAARSAGLVCACSEDDAQYFRSAGAREVAVVPNGVDVSRFEAARGQREQMRRRLGVADDETLFLFPASKFGPNREAYDWLVAFLEGHSAELAHLRARFLVVGGVVPRPERHGKLEATGLVEQVEPYFAAADFALNPMFSGAGTNVKMADFIAARLPILSTAFGARGYALEPHKSVLVFEPSTFVACVAEAVASTAARRVQLAAAAYQANAFAIDMNRCAQPLADWLNARV